MSALARTIARARSELAVNPRLRAALWAIAGLLFVYWLLIRSTDLATVHDEYAAALDRLTRTEALLAREDWAELLKAARQADGELEKRLWRAQTSGQAQAQLRAAVAAIIEDLDIRDPRIQSGLSESVPEFQGLWRAQARLSGGYRSGAQLQVLRAIAVHPNKLIIDRLDLTRGRNPRMVLLLSAYFVGIGADPAQN